jgi:cation:H+ antiporter
LVAGLALLLVGAELVVRSSSSLAQALRVPPLIVGLTVVAVGTSLPELAIGIDAVRTGNTALAVGNIVGTNLVNLLLILGLTALLVPVVLDRWTLHRDLPCVVGASLLFVLLALDGTLSRLDGTLLCVVAVGYTALVVLTSRSAGSNGVADPPAAAVPPGARTWIMVAILLVAGLAAIVVGAELLVDGASQAATSLGVSDEVIGLTIVAIGTSAPELVTAVVSTIRGQRDVAIGNLLGSSVYNIVLVLGITVVASPGGVPVPTATMAADLALFAFTAVLAIPVFLTGGRISRIEGALAVATYIGYLSWLLVSRT